MSGKKHGITRWILGLIGCYILVIFVFLFLCFAYSKTYGSDITSNKYLEQSREPIAKAMSDLTQQGKEFGNYTESKLPDKNEISHSVSLGSLSINETMPISKVNIDTNGKTVIKINGTDTNVKLADISLIPNDSQFAKKNYNGINALIQGALNGKQYQVAKNNKGEVFVYVDGKLLQAKLLSLGLAYVNTPDLGDYRQVLTKAQDYGKTNQMNMWQIPNIVNNYRYNYQAENESPNGIPSLMIAKGQHNYSVWDNVKQMFN